MIPHFALVLINITYTILIIIAIDFIACPIVIVVIVLGIINILNAIFIIVIITYVLCTIIVMVIHCAVLVPVKETVLIIV